MFDIVLFEEHPIIDAAHMHYTTKATDTLDTIAQRFALPKELLLAFNRRLAHSGALHAGLVLKIPSLDDIPAGDIEPELLDASDMIQRARSAINKGIRYKLSEGGMDPSLKLPTANKLCDCSGFVCWVLGVWRKTDNPFYKKFGGWIYTDSMVEDIRSTAGIFHQVFTPEIGCIAVYDAGARTGHVGIVSEVSNGRMAKVIHCSAGNDRNFNDAIQETSPRVFERADTVWGRFTML